MRVNVTGFVLSLTTLAFTVPASAQVVINEILADVGSLFDGAEFIELYNPTGSAVNLTNWVITGTEFNGTCGGEDHWQFPSGASIAAGDYLVIAKDNIDTVPGDEDDGFLQRFGFDPDYEMVDLSFGHDTDDPSVPNLILLTPESFNDQIGLVGASASDDGYGATCAGTFNQYEALYLYNGDPGGGGTVVDEIEWREPSTCLVDACTGVGSSDNDAFLGLPGIGQALCRDASGTDTNNSGADLFLGTTTPGAANIANAGPLLSSMALSNPAPKTTETVDVSIVATDSDGIGAMFVVYSVNGGPADSVSMSSVGTDQYAGTIPAQLDGDQVAYFVRARDAGTAAGVGVSKYPDYQSRSLAWGTQTIFDVQFHSPASDTGFSALVGTAVNVEGTVTTEPGPFNTTSNNLITMQSGPGFWNGVTVIDFLGELNVQRGDSLRVSGEVGEYFGYTQVQIFGNAAAQVLDSNRPLPAPTDVTASQLTTGAPIAEALEGVYVHMDSVTVTLDDDGFGNWHVSDGTGTATIGDEAFINYTPVIGDSLDAIEGIVGYAFSERVLQPRDDQDIQGPPLVSTVRYAPIPPTAASAITISALITDNGTITRSKLYFSTDNGGTYDSTDMVDNAGTYEASVGPFANGTILDYHIEVTDNSGFTGQSPSVGDFDLRVGLQTIETVQSNTSATSDSSAFEGLPTNLSGIVTMAPGTTADNIFALQNNWVTDPAFHGIQVFSGGSLVGALELGDSVTVSGDVDEFFGLTQCRMHFTDAYVNHGQVGEIQGFSLDTSDFLPDSTGVLPASEAWESVLIQFDGSTVTNAAAGFGQYYLDNTAPTTGQETLVDDETRFSGLTYAPTAGDMFTYRGIGSFAFGDYILLPRNDSDILPFDPNDAVGVNPGLVAGLGFQLAQNTPNPFSRAATRISFALPSTQPATLRVFDVQGRAVRTLVNGMTEAGAHTVTWNGRNDSGLEVASGVYFYRLDAADQTATRKAIVLR
ncbi:MAG: hypothetical protein DHS20C21_12710 [Gemmatimonadota bacterium]|nr:MAG: hypothetical protein DHS20C21_12710 [Gemmatimonadota bacterium]